MRLIPPDNFISAAINAGIINPKENGAVINPLTNPSFEIGNLDGWGNAAPLTDATFIKSADFAHEGVSSLRVTGSNNEDGCRYHDLVDFTGCTTLKYWLKVVDGITDTAYVGVVDYAPDSPQFHEGTKNTHSLAVPSDWTEYSISLAAHQGLRYVYVTVATGTPDDSFRFYVDDFRVE